jgi:putative endonuclease
MPRIPFLDRTARYCVYIVGSLSGTLYIGVTNDLLRRLWQHKHKAADGFTARYGVDRLLYFERYRYIRNAIAREKQLKGWTRAKKIALIESMNAEWRDLSKQWFGSAPSTRARERARSG